METDNDKSGKIYYNIAEVAEMFNVNQSLLRFWEKEFPQISPKTNARGVRKYQKEDIDLIKLIYYLIKEKGMTIPGARQRLENERKSVRKNYDIATRLKRIREELKRIRKGLDEIPDTDEKRESSIL